MSFMDGRRTVRNYDYTLNILMYFILISSIAINLKFSRSSIMDRISSRPSRESPKPTANGGTVNVFDRLSAGGKSGSKTSLASSRSDVRSSTNNLTAGIRGTTQSRYSSSSKKTLYTINQIKTFDALECYLTNIAILLKYEFKLLKKDI